MAFSFVKRATGATGASSATGTSAPFSGSTSNGNVIIVAVEYNGTTLQTLTVTDNKGNTYTRILQKAGTRKSIELWWTKDITGGSSHSVSVSGVSSDYALIAHEYSGFTSGAIVDRTASASGLTGIANSGNTATTNAVEELVIGIGGDDISTTSLTVGTGFGNFGQVSSGNSQVHVYLEDKNVSATGAYNATFDNPTNTDWIAGVATFSNARPTVTTQAVSGNTALFSATGNGNVTSAGDSAITERGVAINTTGTPTTADTTFTSAGTTGAFTANMTSLIPGQIYYVRAYAINDNGTSYGSEVSFTAINFLNPTNAYTEDGTFCTAGGNNGDINIELSGDNGATWSNRLSKTFDGTNAFLTYGAGSTELWGESWTGSNLDDANFLVRVSTGTRTGFTKIWKDFGFALAGGALLTGLEIKVKAKWITDTTSIDVIQVKAHYGSSVLPIEAGSQAYATDAGGGTGALEVFNGTDWMEIVDTESDQTLEGKTIDGADNTLLGILGSSLGNQIGVQATRSSVLGINNNTTTAVTWNAEAFDSSGFFTPSSTTITIPAGQGGLYFLCLFTQFASNGTGIRNSFIQVNGNNVAGNAHPASADPSGVARISVMSIEELADGDTITASVFQNSGGSLNLSTLAKLTAIRLGTI